ncbi:hypothetical protein GGI56_004563 [Agrobacterium tumefaciens]|nr:hypothetical protein [Agrobacterium radiobacter]
MQFAGRLRGERRQAQTQPNRVLTTFLLICWTSIKHFCQDRAKMASSIDIFFVTSNN